MNYCRTLLILFAPLSSGCANYEGWYEPGCIAYEGDRIELRAGRFEWQRFTDERRIDDAGKRVPPFPEFPKIGSYRISADRLELVTDDDVRLQDWFIVQKAEGRYLLNSEQHEAFLAAGEVPKCALALSAADQP